MRIDRLSIKGLLAVRGTLALDFTSIPAGSLIAIVGAIGNGKTTVMEAPLATTHRTLPSRDKALPDYATERDSYLETDFTLDGRGSFRGRVNLDGVKGGADAVLSQIAPNGRPVPLTDGRVTTYDAAIAEILPSLDMILASSCSAQNKAGNFVGKKQAARRDFFNALLGNERYERMAATAKGAVGFIEASRGRLAVVKYRLALETAPAIFEDLEARVALMHREAASAEGFIADLDQQIAVLDARLATVADQAAAYQAATLRVQTLRTEREARQREWAVTKTRLSAHESWYQDLLTTIGRVSADRHATLNQRLVGNDRDLTATLSTIATTATVARKDLQDRIASNQDVFNRRAQIRQAAARVVAIGEEAQAQRQTLQEAHQAVTVQTDDVRVLQRRLDDVERAVTDVGRVTRDAHILTVVPFGGKCAEAGCQFVSAAAQAQAQLPALRELADTRPALVAALGEAGKLLDRAQDLVQATARSIFALEAEQSTVAKVAKDAGRADAAEARIEELQRQIATIDANEPHQKAEAERRHAAIAADLTTQRSAIQVDEATARNNAERQYRERLAELTQAQEETARVGARLSTELATAEAELQGATAGNAMAVTIQTDLGQFRGRRDQSIATVARVKAEAESLERSRGALALKRDECQRLTAKLLTLDTWLLEWQILHKAFSRDGLPVLEIDAAGPTVSAYTNDLLNVCFGPRFTVELVTQQAKADGKGLKEEFTVKVYDNQRGGEPRDIADLSGGEQVIVSEALMNAIAVYVNTRSPQPIRTCWRDETTGSLDKATARQYLTMLRKVQELGGFHHVFFITHNPDAAAQADVQIRMHDGEATMVYPPFAEAA